MPTGEGPHEACCWVLEILDRPKALENLGGPKAPLDNFLVREDRHSGLQEPLCCIPNTFTTA